MRSASAAAHFSYCKEARHGTSDHRHGALSGDCRLSDVAARLEVSKASANNAMNVLASRGLVESEKYREIRLTEQGLRLAELLSHKHTILQRLLTQVMGVDPEQAYEDACAIEHVISADSVAHIQDFLRRYPPRSDQT